MSVKFDHDPKFDEELSITEILEEFLPKEKILDTPVAGSRKKTTLDSPIVESRKKATLDTPIAESQKKATLDTPIAESRKETTISSPSLKSVSPPVDKREEPPTPYPPDMEATISLPIPPKKEKEITHREDTPLKKRKIDLDLGDSLSAENVQEEKQINIKNKVDNRFSQFFSPDGNLDFEDSQTITGLKEELNRNLKQNKVYDDYSKLKESRQGKVKNFHVSLGKRKKDEPDVFEQNTPKEEENSATLNTASIQEENHNSTIEKKSSPLLKGIKKKGKQEKVNHFVDIGKNKRIGLLVLAISSLVIPAVYSLGVFPNLDLGMIHVLLFTASYLTLILDCQNILRSFKEIFHLQMNTDTLLSLGLVANILGTLSTFGNLYHILHFSLITTPFILVTRCVFLFSNHFVKEQFICMQNHWTEDGKSPVGIHELTNLSLVGQIATRLIPDNYYIVGKSSVSQKDLAEHSLPHYRSIPTTKYVLFVLFLSFFSLFVVSFLQKDFFLGISVTSTLIVSSIPFILGSSLALSILKSKDELKKSRAILPSFLGMKALKNINCIIVDDRYLFPKESISLNGIKTFGTASVDTVIIYLASIFANNHSSLAEVFSEVIEHNDDFLLPVSEFKYENSMGYSAVIGKDIVLVGNRNLLINHSIPILKQSVEEQYTSSQNRVMYVSINNQVAAVFVLEYAKSNQVVSTLKHLLQEDTALAIRVSDPSVTPELIHDIYEYPKEGVTLINSEIVSEIQNNLQEAPLKDRIIFDGTTHAYLSLLKWCKKSYGYIHLSTILQMSLSIIFVLTFLVTQVFLGMSFFTQTSFFLYQVILTVIGLLPVLFTKLDMRKK